LWGTRRLLGPETSDFGDDDIRIAAARDRITIGFTRDTGGGFNGGRRAATRTSYNGGQTWEAEAIVPSAATGQVQFFAINADGGFDNGSGGWGDGVVFAWDAGIGSGGIDGKSLKHRGISVNGPWDADVSLSPGIDSYWSGPIAIVALEPRSSGAPYAYGVVHQLQDVNTPVIGNRPRPYFTRVEPCAWLGDLSDDGSVDLADLLQVLAAFGTSDPAGDATGDEAVDLADVLLVLSEFGLSCASG